MFKTLWTKIKKYFKDSETIFLARLQVVVGAISTYFVWFSTSPEMTEAFKNLLQPKYIPFYVLGLGFLTEYLRRRRSDLK